jgi:endonuclease III
MMMDCLFIMRIVLITCDHYCIEPIRWKWDFLLLEAITCKNNSNQTDSNLRTFAMLVCLVLAAVTNDKACIQSTVQLFNKGLLSAEAMANAPLEDLKACIAEAGIQHRKAQYLQSLARTIMEKHNGVVPSNYDKLIALLGVGRKSIVLILNEAFGFFFGIGTDSHVMRVALSLGMVTIPAKMRVASPELVETSLRQWIPKRKFKNVNRIFGGFAQLVVHDIHNPNKPDHLKKLSTFVKAIGDRLHKPYEIQVVIFVVARLRAHYAKGLPKGSPFR